MADYWTGDAEDKYTLGLPYLSGGIVGQSNTNHLGEPAYCNTHIPPLTPYSAGWTALPTLRLLYLSHLLFALIGGVPGSVTTQATAGVLSGSVGVNG